MERLILNKEEMLDCLKEPLESFYDIELDDIIIYITEDKRTIYLSYFILYHGMRQKTVLPFDIGGFIKLLKLAVERKKHFTGTNLVILPGEELKCRVNYKVTDLNYGRRRKK